MRMLMVNVMYHSLYALAVTALLVVFPHVTYAQNDNAQSTLLFTGKTAGSVDMLARQATAIGRLKGESGLVIHTGSLLGSTRIVRFDDGMTYLAYAEDAGIDYIIPSGEEFSGGSAMFRLREESERCPDFLSANLVNERTGNLFVRPYAIRIIAGKRYCIIGMSDMDTVRNAPDADVRGVDVISPIDALERIAVDILALRPDNIILVGRLSREDIEECMRRFPFINMVFTTFRSGGFAVDGVETTSVTVNGKSVFIGPESANRLGMVSVRYIDGVPSYEVGEIRLGDAFPPDKAVVDPLDSIVKNLIKQDYEDSVMTETGHAVAEILRKDTGVDAVLLERGSLYFYPLEDSLQVLNIRQVLRSGTELVSFQLPGDHLKSAWERSVEAEDPERKLVFAGLTQDGKVDSIPIQDDRMYVIAASRFLVNGGNGYEEFTKGIGHSVISSDILRTVERFLVLKEERIREASKEKIWDLNLYLTLNSNYNRTEVDEDKDLYGKRISKPFVNMTDEYASNFILSSQNNKLTVKKTIDRHDFDNYLKFSFSRQGTKTQESDKLQYNTQRNHDPVELFGKYTYNIEQFPVEPYFDATVNSFLYSGTGRHPITATMSAGATRTFPKLIGLNLSVGLQATRDYYELENNFGTKSSMTISKKFPAKSLLTSEVSIDSKTNVFWNPTAEYDMEFKMDSDNSVHLQIWKNINLSMTFRAYAYRNSEFKKVAFGYNYLVTLDYGMHWKF